MRGTTQSRRDGFTWNGTLAAIGASAGGVEALMIVVKGFPAACPATLIVQHIPAGFVSGFAKHLNEACPARVCEAYDAAPLAPGIVYIAPADRHLEVFDGPSGWSCLLRDSEPVNGFRPSVDVLFNSVARAAGSRAVGVIMTGMGRDGAEGLMKMREVGAVTLGQDRRTSTVYGMPKVAFESGAVERQVSLRGIAPAILDICNARLTENR